MCSIHKHVHLGFSDEPVPAGTHMCLVFNSALERTDSLFSFLHRGLLEKERAACFSDEIDEKTLSNFLLSKGLRWDKLRARDTINLSKTSDAYFQNDTFDPERMLQTLKNYYEESKRRGFAASRVIGEMTPQIKTVRGGERMLEYEAKVTILLRDYPITSVCLYDANQFDGATILEVLKVHPQMIVNGAVVQNPFFVPPEEFLARYC